MLARLRAIFVLVLMRVEKLVRLSSCAFFKCSISCLSWEIVGVLVLVRALVVVLAVFVLVLLVSDEVWVLVVIVGALSLFLRLLTMRLLPSPLI